MLAGFVDHLSEFADSTSDYHDKIEICVEKIGKADDITQLQDVLADVISETRIIQVNAQRSRDDLRTTKLRVEEADVNASMNCKVNSIKPARWCAMINSLVHSIVAVLKKPLRMKCHALSAENHRSA